MPTTSNLMALVATLTLDKSGYEKGLEDAKDDASSFSGGLSRGFGLLAKGAMVAYGAAASAAGMMAKQAVNAYASYEQLAGGIQKLYGEDFAPAMMKMAEQAYKTSGMSVNAYMETATGFSAALIKSVDGDMQKAVELTDVAMQAISDNVNTFGTNAEAVTNAFMGLSRQNYMMIDNLKLGYAGSAQGMMELINDSGVLGYTLTNTSQLADVGFAKMVEAIQAVQEAQGIAGTTAKEAMTTIEGASRATQAAWENVITAIGRGEGLEDAFGSLTESLFGVGLLDGKETGLVNLMITRVETVFEGIGNFVAKASPMITQKLPALFKAIIPAVINGANGLFKGLISAIPPMFDAVVDLVMNEGLELINSLSEGIQTGLPVFLSQALPMLLTFVQGLAENANTLIDAGIQLVWSLVNGLIEGLPTLIEYVPQIVETVANIINDNAPKLLLAALQMILALGKGIIDNIPVIIENAGNIVSAIVSVISAMNWLDLGQKLVTLLSSGIKALMKLPVDAFKNIGRSIIQTFQNGFSWSGLGRNIINGIVSGIRNAGHAIKDALLGIVGNAKDAVLKYFGISSPSKVMRDEVGKWIPIGMAKGISDYADSVSSAMQKMSEDAYATIDVQPRSNYTGDGYGTGDINQEINIYSPTQLDPSEVARQTRNANRDVILALRGV